MARVKLPRRADTAFSRLAFSESLKSLIALGTSPEHISYFDDFVGSPTGAWPANANWMYPAPVGTTPVVGITAAAGGTLTATTAAASPDGAYQYLGLNWAVLTGIYAIWRAKISSIATAKFEIGLTDSITNQGIVNVKATPTYTATNAAAFSFDTADTTTVDFMTVNGGVAGAKVTGKVLDTNYHWYEIVVSPGGFASGYMDGVFIGGGPLATTAVLGPQIAGATTRAAAALTATVDLAACVGSRS